MTKAGMINTQPVLMLCEHTSSVDIPPRGQLGQAKGAHTKRMSRFLEVPLEFLFLLHTQINRLITLISNANGRSLLAHIYIVRAGLTKVQGVPTAQHHFCFFSPNQIRSTQPLAFVIPCGSCRSRDEVFLLLSPYCRSLRGRRLCSGRSVDHRHPVSITHPPRPILRIYSIPCSGRTWFNAHLLILLGPVAFVRLLFVFFACSLPSTDARLVAPYFLVRLAFNALVASCSLILTLPLLVVA